jgi:predicted transcriptional regulator
VIKLTPTEATIYEFMKTGQYTTTEISEAVGKPLQTVRDKLTYLLRAHVAKREGKRGHFVYTVKVIEYTVKSKPVSVEVKFEAPTNDKLLQHSINVELSEDKKFYLKQHKGKVSRTSLAKRLGLTKLELNFALERLG